LEGAQVDVAAFEEALSRDDPASLQAAVHLYRGPLLEGCTEEWVFQERQAREQAYLKALERLASVAMEQGTPGPAAEYLRRALGIDPVGERRYRALMAALAQGGDYAGVMQVYRQLRLLLSEQLRAEPSWETSALYERLREEGRLRASASASALPL